MTLIKRADLYFLSFFGLKNISHFSTQNDWILYSLMSVTVIEQDHPSHEYMEKGLLSKNIIWELIRNVIAQLN